MVFEDYKTVHRPSIDLDMLKNGNKRDIRFYKKTIVYFLCEV